MTPAEVAELLDGVGLGGVKIRADKVHAQCPFHGDTHPSLAVMTGGRFPGYYCIVCGERGSILNLVWRMIAQRGKPFARELLAAHDAVAQSKMVPRSRLDYVPMATEPEVTEHPVWREDSGGS